MKKFFINFLICAFIVFKIVNAISFWDLHASHWAYTYITSLTEKGVINGYEDMSFKPEGTITNGEFIKLVVMASLPEWIDLNDAESKLNHWAGKYVWIAERYGVLNEGSIKLSNIDTPITRIDMVRIIAKADLLMKGNSLKTNQKIKFSDVLSLNSEDMQLLKHALSKNLITGYTDNTFRPTLNMTRAEAATMIYRLSE